MSSTSIARGNSGAGSILDVIDPGAYPAARTHLWRARSLLLDGYGRVTVQLLSGGTSLLPLPYLAGYIVDSPHIQLTETGDNYRGVLGGMVLGQWGSTGQFTVNSVTGSSFVFGVTGADKYGTFQVARVLSFDTGRAVGGTPAWNDGSTT